MFYFWRDTSCGWELLHIQWSSRGVERVRQQGDLVWAGWLVRGGFLQTQQCRTNTAEANLPWGVRINQINTKVETNGPWSCCVAVSLCDPVDVVYCWGGDQDKCWSPSCLTTELHHLFLRSLLLRFKRFHQMYSRFIHRLKTAWIQTCCSCDRRIEHLLLYWLYLLYQVQTLASCVWVSKKAPSPLAAPPVPCSRGAPQLTCSAIKFFLWSRSAIHVWTRHGRMTCRRKRRSYLCKAPWRSIYQNRKSLIGSSGEVGAAPPFKKTHRVVEDGTAGVKDLNPRRSKGILTTIKPSQRRIKIGPTQRTAKDNWSAMLINNVNSDLMTLVFILVKVTRISEGSYVLPGLKGQRTQSTTPEPACPDSRVGICRVFTGVWV